MFRLHCQPILLLFVLSAFLSFSAVFHVATGFLVARILFFAFFKILPKNHFLPSYFLSPPPRHTPMPLFTFHLWLELVFCKRLYLSYIWEVPICV